MTMRSPSLETWLRGFARLFLVGAVLGAILAAACTAADRPAEDRDQPAGPGAAPARDPLPALEGFAREGLISIGATRAEIVARLGEPDSARTAVVPNRHRPGVQDTLFTLHYPALVARIHTPGGGRDLLSSVEVTDDRHLRDPLLGATRAEVEAAWGAPREVRDGWWVYDCASCGEADSPLELAFSDDDRVRAVRFTYYVD